ncbi:nucleotidyltransferase domain-containing protein [Bdellovibrio sp. BCCA]|uniref:nucleotidyltransferase domain-containing protein n=1 Tax=Bdellovibrio sp. BCCA TaxID=3136281 RepID=UPI0030F18316
MRLSSKEVSAIKNAFAQLFPNAGCTIYLFGSRTQDNRKGGDIDLLVVTSDRFKEEIVNGKSRIRLKIFETIPEQKIDITVATPVELVTDTFLLSIQDDLIRL